jgi:hypothetical protein
MQWKVDSGTQLFIEAAWKIVYTQSKDYLQVMTEHVTRDSFKEGIAIIEIRRGTQVNAGPFSVARVRVYVESGPGAFAKGLYARKSI